MKNIIVMLFFLIFIVSCDDNINYHMNKEGVDICYDRTIPVNMEEINERSNAAGGGPKTPFIVDLSNFSFIVVADTHYNFNSIKLEKIKSKALDANFIMIAGDLTNSGNPYQYDALEADMQRITVPVLPVIGNHDRLHSGWGEYNKRFGKNYYSIEIGKTLIIALDTASGALGEKQKNWLINLLDNNSSENRILITHFQEYKLPLYPQKEVMDIVEKYKIQLCIFGHEHIFHMFKQGESDYIILNKQGHHNDSIIVSIKNNKLNWDIK